jgi:PAS domain S-box-containing protein
VVDKRLRQALRAVSGAVLAISESEADYGKLLQTVVRSVADALGDCCAITLRSDDGTTLTPVAMYDRDPGVVEAFKGLLNQPLPFAKTLVGANGMGRPLFIQMLDTSLLEGQLHPPMLELIRTIGVHSLIAIPLSLRGQTFGVLHVMRHRKDMRSLDDVDFEITEHVATHAALALGNAKLARERTRAQEALKESEALRAMEARAAEANRFVDAILEHIPDMVFVKEANELRFVRFNRAGEELLGVPRPQLIGKNDYDFFPKSEADFFVAKDRETLAGKKLVEITEEPIQTRNGQRWLHTKKVPIVDEAGVPRYLLGISQDITEDKQVKAQLLAAKDKAEAANRELEAFSYSVAHDLRAPLRGVDGFAQALIEDYADKLDEDGRRHLGRIRAAAQRMASLIDDLLNLSRVTRSEFRREPVDLTRVAKLSLANLQRLEPERAIKVTIADGMQATGDARLLAIVFDNLLGNAWKFTTKTTDPYIEIGVETDGSERVYFVRDNGAGFDPAYRDKLFGVFQRLHSVSDFPGTGIGLATVLRIVERHGGRVWADGEVGKGATFRFTLPESC